LLGLVEQRGVLEELAGASLAGLQIGQHGIRALRGERSSW
jgi:hypothetical protein